MSPDHELPLSPDSKAIDGLECPRYSLHGSWPLDRRPCVQQVGAILLCRSRGLEGHDWRNTLVVQTCSCSVLVRWSEHNAAIGSTRRRAPSCCNPLYRRASFRDPMVEEVCETREKLCFRLLDRCPGRGACRIYSRHSSRSVAPLSDSSLPANVQERAIRHLRPIA